MMPSSLIVNCRIDGSSALPLVFNSLCYNPPMSGFGFELVRTDERTRARRGRIRTPHGLIETPVFMPVGTRAVVKTLTPEEVEETGAQIVLANTYHLLLRPGVETVEEAGGLHEFMNWHGPILTDSGGFQIFSLGPLVKLTDEDVTFRSPIDGATHTLTPESCIEIERRLGADIVMALDQCVTYPAGEAAVAEGVRRTTAWAKRCKQAFEETDDERQALFGIVQGGAVEDLRRRSAEAIAGLDFAGNAVGGLSVGEPRELMLEVLGYTLPILPEAKPRYLMGLGDPVGMLEAIVAGIDMFDSALPTRMARNGTVFTHAGRLNIKNARHSRDLRPVDPACSCYTCTHFTRAYLRHLYTLGEILAHRLLTYHSLFYLNELISQARDAIVGGGIKEFVDEHRRLLEPGPAQDS